MDGPKTTPGGVCAPTSHATDPAAPAPVSAIDRERLIAEVRDLRNPWRQRYTDLQVVLLHDEGRTRDDIAGALHLPPDAVDAALERAASGDLRPPLRAAVGRAGSALSRAARAPRLQDLVIVGSFAALVAVLPVRHLIGGGRFYGQNDVPIHITLAAEVRLIPFHTPVPHFLLHVLIKLFDVVLGSVGLPFGASVGIVMVGSRAAIGAAAYAVVTGWTGSEGPRLERRPALLAVCLVLVAESPRILFDGAKITDGHAFLPLQYYFNPTATLATAFALLTPSALERLVRSRAAGGTGRRTAAWACGVVVLGALAKPSFAQVVLPVLPFWAWWLTRRAEGSLWPVVRSLAAWVVVPVVAVMAWQLWFIANGLPPELRGGFIWSPWLVARAWGIGHWTATIGLVLPLSAAVVTKGRWFRQPTVALLVPAFVVGVVQFMLLAEGGDQTIHGNLGHAGQIIFVLLSVEAARTLAVELAVPAWREGSAAALARRSAASVVVAACVVSGVIGYVASLS